MAKKPRHEENAGCLATVPALKNKLVPVKRLDETVLYMRLLSHPTRIQILRLLSESELCVCVIERALEKTQPNISQHLSKLKDSRIIESRQRGKYIFYRIRDKRILKIIKSI
ncbi:MAG: helix-turn-helix transcriptional regulator [Candidatus Altiarchaeota archaeon]|nr:helix-turn-helix transcriptional regulator [Candidatus Altiarchaeota archaeon]